MSYIDGFVIPVPNAKKAAYMKSAEIAAAVFKEYGALGVTECWGDDVPPGKLTSFPLAVKLTENEVVVFSWVVWPSRAARVCWLHLLRVCSRRPALCPLPCARR